MQTEGEHAVSTQRDPRTWIFLLCFIHQPSMHCEFLKGKKLMETGEV